MSTIQLQSIGHVPAIEALEVREGDLKMYNFGSTALIVKVIEKTPKTLTIIEFSNDSKEYYMYDVRKTSLVAIVKRDQDVSEHKPNEAHYRRKGIVNVSEYFQVEEVAAVATEQIEIVTPVEKVEIKEITFLWSESPVVKDNTTVKTFSEAESIIFEIACHKNTQGYDKTKFMITWENGHTYTGRIDVLSSYTSGKELKKHIEDHCTFFAGLRKGYHETIEEYENTLRAYGITEEDKREYKLFLDTYLLEDVSTETIEVIENVEVENEIIETIQTEITYQTNTGTKGNGIEITFTEKPSEDIRNAMKANGYRWGGKQRPSIWWAIMNDETISLAEQLAGEQTTTNEQQTKVNFEYPEVLIDDCTDDKYNIPQSLQDREHDAYWVMRSTKRDHNKEIQELFTHYTEQVKNVLTITDNEYYIYKLKSSLQRFKKNYHTAYIKYITHKANNPSWVTTGRGGMNVSRYNQKMSHQDKLMLEVANLPEEMKNEISKYKNKIRKDKESALKEQLKQELKQPLPELTFKTVTKEFDLYNNGIKVKTRFYECEGYSICKVWGAFRVYEIATGKEIHSTKSNGTLQDAKAYVSLMVKQQRQAS